MTQDLMKISANGCSDRTVIESLRPLLMSSIMSLFTFYINNRKCFYIIVYTFLDRHHNSSIIYRSLHILTNINDTLYISSSFNSHSSSSITFTTRQTSASLVISIYQESISIQAQGEHNDKR